MEGAERCSNRPARADDAPDYLRAAARSFWHRSISATPVRSGYSRLQRLRYRRRLANADAKRLRAAAAALIGRHGTPAPPSFHGLRVLLFVAGREAARDALALAQAESEAPPSDAAFAAADRFLADAPVPKLPISGADLIGRGISTGRPVGQTLRAFQALWIHAGFPKDAETLTRLLEEAVAGSTAAPDSGKGT